MLRSSKSRLLATSAVAGLVAHGLAVPANAQNAFGVHVNTPDPQVISVPTGETVYGTVIGVYADNGPVDLTVEENAEVRSDGTNTGGPDTRSEGGVVIAQPDSIVNNSGLISSSASGVTTTYFFGEDANDEPLPPQPLTSNTTVINTSSGSIIGEGGSGVSIIGGGSVANDGLIRGTGTTNSTGVLIAGYPDRIDAGGTGIGSITNGADATIEGGVFGVLLSGGGSIVNEGTIRSLNQQAAPGTSPFGVILSATAEQEGREATLNNSGSIEGLLGVLVQGTLVNTTVENSGTIQGVGAGMFLNADNGLTTINNAADGVISGGSYAIRANAGEVVINNAADAQITSNGNAIDIVTPGAIVNNAGLIEGGQYGVQAILVLDPIFAAATQINNSGSIIGNNNDGVRLAGGGSVINSGTIAGLQGPQSDGISMFPQAEQANEDYFAHVVNQETGSIYGSRFGVIMSAGGDISNAGDIQGVQGGVFIQGIALNSGVDEDRSDLTASVTNTGSILGEQDFGVGFGSDLLTAALVNEGSITSLTLEGVSHNSRADLTVTNAATGVIEGATSGIYSGASGALMIENAGTIRGNGIYDGLDAAPDAGITIATARSSVNNSGTIAGAGAGITTAYQYDAEADALLLLAVDTVVTNSGTITGEANDGVRLIGGGSVINSGTITGTGAFGADGISMFPGPDQANADYTAEVTNLDTGTIAGDRFGVILTGGGTVDNAGDIAGDFGGVLVQAIAANSDDDEDRAGLVGIVTNSGSIRGTGSAENEAAGVAFGSDLGEATLINSGLIASDNFVGVTQGSLADLLIQNLEGGTIEGATSGIYGGSGGSMIIENAGTIRGNGTYDGFDASPDAGITIATGNSSVTNSGTISGAGTGITTASVFDPEQNVLVGQAVGTLVINSGTISGEANDGVRLIGGGTVTNSGLITGAGAPGADGISMFRFEDQTTDGYSAAVFNDADGDITGDRFGVVLSGGGAITNAGSIVGNLGGVVIQSQGDETGQTAFLENIGSIDGGSYAGAAFNAFVDTVEVINSGTITSTSTGIASYSNGDFSLVNSGTIHGELIGIDTPNLGAVSVTNSGTIVGEADVALATVSRTTLVNAGTLQGGGNYAVILGAADDTVILQTGSNIVGAVDAGEGSDSLALEGDVLELSEDQVLGATENFELLKVSSGYWNTQGFAGAFDSVTIDEGASLQVNEALFEEETFAAIETSVVINDGTLLLNLSQDDIVDKDLAITGTGNLVLLGEAEITVESDALAYTGGTTVANGGLILTGTLAGDVTTNGDGFFQLGIGGTEGNFSGDIVNDGRFVFNRSDDYDFEGAFTGSGILDKYGAGTLAFLGDYGFVGVTNIFGGTVRIGGIINPETDFDLADGGSLDIAGNDQTIGGLAGSGGATVSLGAQTLTVDQDENTEFAGVIEGSGNLVLNGNGTLNLTGNSTYTGETLVNGGTLAVNGSIVSNVTVNSGGTLGGNGSTGSATISNGGTLAPGNSIGRLTVNGDLAFAAGSIYEVEVNAAGQADRVDATGNVTIASTASMSILAEDGNYAPRTDYVVITGAGGVSGTFGTVTTDLAFLDPLLRYSSDQVTLSLYRNDIAFADAAVGVNQASIANAIQALGIDNPLFEAVLVQNTATARQSFTDLSGEIVASTVAGLTDESRHLRNTLMALDTPSETGLFAWASGFGGWSDFDGGLGLSSDHLGLVGGLGYAGRGIAVALSGGIGSSDFEMDGRSDEATSDSTFVAAHATFGNRAGFNGGAGVAYAWHDLETARSVSVPALAQTLVSQRDAETAQAFGELGYGFVFGNALVTAVAELAHVSTDAETFAEAGGSASLAGADTEMDTTYLSLGARIGVANDEAMFRPFASAAWNRTFGDRLAVQTSRFASGGPEVRITGVAIPKNSIELEAGFEFDVGGAVLGAAYSGAMGGSRDAHGARVSILFSF